MTQECDVSLEQFQFNNYLSDYYRKIIDTAYSIPGSTDYEKALITDKLKTKLMTQLYKICNANFQIPNKKICSDEIQ